MEITHSVNSSLTMHKVVHQIIKQLARYMSV